MVVLVAKRSSLVQCFSEGRVVDKNWYIQRDTCVGFHSNSIHFTLQEKLWGRDESFLW